MAQRKYGSLIPQLASVATDVGMAASVVFALFAILYVHSATAECPAGSIQGLDRSSCYVVHASALSWLEAEGRCKAENGHLATVATCRTNSFVAQVTANVSNATDYWLGGVWNAERADAWFWANGSTWNYTNWETGQPVNGSGCLAYNARTSKWSAADCSKAMPYLCQVSPTEHKGHGSPSPPPKLPAPPAPLRCPYGWQYLEETNLCYTILEHRHTAYSWNQAKTLCSDAGGGLLSIPNKTAGDAIVTSIKKTPTPPTPVRCPDGWLYLEASNLCYAVMEPRKNQYTWTEARNVCTEAGGDLASIPNRAVNNALVRRFSPRLTPVNKM